MPWPFFTTKDTGKGAGLGLCICRLIMDMHEGGVSMGGELVAADGTSPSFLVWALADPAGTPLQRVQIVKGWIEDGKTHEKVVDVAGGKGSGRVDTATCETSGRGADQLCTVWRDEDFEASQRAFYYERATLLSCRSASLKGTREARLSRA